ncbi:MAG TPA: GH92 family glycosyl hydrolase [Chitinophagales bacterium]|nr:GH92 family glycosyl hydrolase [Chitinophagales bacterium]
MNKISFSHHKPGRLFLYLPAVHLKILLVSFLFNYPTTAFSQTSLTPYVNPFIGTGGHGHTFPGAAFPFGMIQLSPDTRIDDSWDGCGGYHYSDSIIYGFTHTHLSGTGVSDYGDVLLMPTLGEPVLTPFKDGSYKKGYASHFSHASEAASPGYYSVHLDDDNLDAAFTVSSRVGIHKYTFPKSEQSNIILDLAHRDEVINSSIQVIDARHVQGMRRSKGWATDQVLYFAMEFSKQFNSYGISLNDEMVQEVMTASNEHSGKNIQAFFQFNTSSGEAVIVKVGTSAVSMDGARYNLERELPSWDFEQVLTNADATWNYMLNKIEVKGGTEEQKRIFYTALYHCLIAPNAYNDADRNYRGRDGEVHNERLLNYYTVFSLWDTYRALHPLLTFLTPKQDGDFVQTMSRQYQQGGRLPVWELAGNETDCMIGYHSVSVIADAAAKGLKGFDHKEALEAMKASAGQHIYGLPSYRENGCISVEDEGESVSKTLEYAYDDWCIAQMALRINDTATFNTFIQRAQYWKNVFDPSTGFMRPKKNGNFLSPFDPYEVNFNYTEANAWQYRFAVPQDIDGMKRMMGGNQKFEAALDSLFTTTSKTTGREQSDISGLIGQYAHGNEPSHHMAYLYNYVGKPGKTQALVHQILNEMYHDRPDGLIGNEDCGQMSAWYVLSAMGFYPVTPGSPYYALGTPLFDTVKIHLENQKTFTIIAHHATAKDFYIQSMKVDGRSTDTFYISHSMILQGKTVSFQIGSQPGMQPNWITAPPSAINSNLIAVNPVIESKDAVFKESATISIQSLEAGSKIYYTLNNSAPTKKSPAYNKPFSIRDNTTVKAISINSRGVQSKVVTANFLKTDKNWNIKYLTAYNPQYNGGGDLSLIDGLSGDNNFKSGSWQGWWGNTMEVIVDLGKVQTISTAGAEFLQDQKAWIIMPSKVDFEGSQDGQNFTRLETAINNIPVTEKNSRTQTIETAFAPQQVRYVKIIAYNYGKLPADHPGAGGDAWIFCDEIFIR